MLQLKNRIKKLEEKVGHQAGPTAEQYSKAHDRNVQRFLEKFNAVIEQKPLPQFSQEEEERDRKIVRQWCELNGVDIEKKAKEFQREMDRLTRSSQDTDHKGL